MMGYTNCRRYKNVKPRAETSENVGNFYVARAKVGRSDEEMYRNRQNDYGNKPAPEDGDNLPIWISGFNLI